MKLTSDWKGVDLSKKGVSATVSDMCPYLVNRGGSILSGNFQ